MSDRLESVRADSVGVGPSSFTIGTSVLFFLGSTLAAVEFQDQVYVRDDLPLTFRQRRLLNTWRDHSKQIVLDHYSFLVTLNDALLHGMKDVRTEIFTNA